MKYLVRDMMSSLQWGATLDGQSPAHMLKAPVHDLAGSQKFRAECGIYVLPWARKSLLAAPVCKRCLKATEKYA